MPAVAQHRKKSKKRTQVPLDLVPPAVGAPAHRPPRVVPIDRHGPILRPSPLEDDGDVLALNLLAGCPHRCPFCSVRAHPPAAGENAVFFYRNTAAALARELTQRQRYPRAVYLCPSTDPFPPINEIQRESAQVVDVLAQYGIEAWIMTRGFIRPHAMQVLARHPKNVRVTIPLMTLDRGLQRWLEPLAAPPRMRLQQIRELKALGIATQVAIEPLIPGLTDTRANLEELLDGLEAAGVERVSASYLYLRSGIIENLRNELEPTQWAEPIVAAYAGGPILPMGRVAPARLLPRAARQRGYAQLMALAARRGIAVSISSLSNPDFRPPRTPRNEPLPSLRQMRLGYED